MEVEESSNGTCGGSDSYHITSIGNLVIYRSVVGARLGHKTEIPGARLGKGRGKVGTRLRQARLWQASFQSVFKEAGILEKTRLNIC